MPGGVLLDGQAIQLHPEPHHPQEHDNCNDTRAIKAAPRELAFAAIREISASVAALFADNSAADPTLADTGALFNATAVTTKGGHTNLLTTARGTNYTAWDAVAAAMYNQPIW